MPEQLHFELVSPEKLLVSKPVAMVTVPGGEGDYGVLAGHAPLITTVRPGVIDIYEANDNTISDRIFVAGGFAETTAERCTVLAEEAVPVANLNRGQLEEEVKNLSDDMTRAVNPAEAASLEAKLTVAKAKLAAVA
jgi:F-type H+-transporting ATPase subunit epsilon